MPIKAINGRDFNCSHGCGFYISVPVVKGETPKKKKGRSEIAGLRGSLPMMARYPLVVSRGRLEGYGKAKVETVWHGSRVHSRWKP